MKTGNPLERMRGLLGQSPLEKNQGLLITACPSVHTIGMQYPLDLIFLNKDWQIKKLVFSLKPYRMAWSLGASMVIEIRGGTLNELGLMPGTILLWEETTCV
jgi:uncharacterized membrane protein (UPF0127 family)